MTRLKRKLNDTNERLWIAVFSGRLTGITANIFWLVSKDFEKSFICDGDGSILVQSYESKGFCFCCWQTEEEYSLVLTVTDGVIGEENAIKQSLLILVEDVNDNAPVFQPFANTLLIEENSEPAVILTVHATDRDQGVYGQVFKNSTVTFNLFFLLV